MSPQDLVELTALNLVLLLMAPSEQDARDFLAQLSDVEVAGLALFIVEDDAALAA